MSQLPAILTAVGNLSLRYTEALLKDVASDQAARFAAPAGKVVASNHPSFVIGHLAIYPARLMDFLGQPRGITERPAGWEDLFRTGVDCKDDPTGTIYPKLDELSKFYFAAYRAVLAAVAETPSSVFEKPNPAGGRMTEIMPTVGAAATFLLSGHPMSHLGQFSAWRRMMGLPSAF